jgi:hypothetical protein
MRACQEWQGLRLEMKATKDRDAEVRAEVQQGQSFRSLLRACRVWTYMVSAEDGVLQGATGFQVGTDCVRRARFLD